MILARFVIISIFPPIILSASLLSCYHSFAKLHSEPTSVRNLGKMDKSARWSWQHSRHLLLFHVLRCWGSGGEQAPKEQWQQTAGKGAQDPPSVSVQVFDADQGISSILCKRLCFCSCRHSIGLPLRLHSQTP